MNGTQVRVSPAWLRLREAADAAARSPDLVGEVRRLLPPGGRTVVHDLACGTGSMGRWLAPQLPGPQHWVLYDRDADLLAGAAADPPAGPEVTVETRQRDVTRLDSGELAGAHVITASALLDILTAAELQRLVRAATAARCPVLVTLSVLGRVDLVPPDPLDAHVAEAFNDHQRRTAGGRRLLGPDAPGYAAREFTRSGARVLLRPSPWQLGAAEADLAVAWFTGWMGAACEQRPGLSASAAPYVRRRLAEAAGGRLGVTVHHRDLLAVPTAR